MKHELEDIIKKAVDFAIEKLQSDRIRKWMSLKEAAAYAGVSYNTFIKFRVMGLKICEIDGIKRVSKTEIDNFLQANSY